MKASVIGVMRTRGKVVEEFKFGEAEGPNPKSLAGH